MREKTTFALCFGNRGSFPEKLIASARKEITKVLNHLGHKTIMLDEKTTKYGAVETAADGKIYAGFLEEHKGEFGGVILCLPNFGDETGAVSALQDCGVPILVQAYPDEIDKMGVSERRDAFCGKFSVMNVFKQYGLPFTSFTPHAVNPSSDKFAEHIKTFDSVCRVVNGMKRMTVGAIGARTTAFKTVRFDELTLQKFGITTETLDLSEIIQRVENFDSTKDSYEAKAEVLKNYTNWSGVPDSAFSNLVKLGVVLDEIIEEYQMDAIAIRCWIELQKQLKVSPCVLLSELNDRGIPAACELDVTNAVTMFALSLASGEPATLMDWNNNWGEEEDKCILFHCGVIPQSLMTTKGHVVDHQLLVKALGTGCSFGCNVGRMAPNDITYSSAVTKDGKLEFYLGEGKITADVIPKGYFGGAGVVQIDNLQEHLKTIGYGGYRHHVSLTPGYVKQAIEEAFTVYLGYDVIPFN